MPKHLICISIQGFRTMDMIMLTQNHQYSQTEVKNAPAVTNGVAELLQLEAILDLKMSSWTAATLDNSTLTLR
jgi:hypothetical protein